MAAGYVWAWAAPARMVAGTRATWSRRFGICSIIGRNLGCGCQKAGVKALQPPEQTGTGQFTHVAVHQVAFSVIEQGGRQAVAAGHPAELALPVAQHMV